MNDELVKYYKNKYEETLSKLNESEKTVKILNERIEAIERFSVSESDENDDTDDDDDYEEENNVKEKNNV